MKWTNLLRRIEPFLDLLDARYLPLLAVVAPQAWTVYAWLLRDGSPPWVAALGGFGYEAVYVGAVAWAERGAGWSSARPPAVAALLFSVAVAVAYYAPTVGTMAILHAGFPVVAYAYTVSMHAAAHAVRAPVDDSAAPVAPVVALSKTERVKAVALSNGVSETTIWRKVKAGEVEL